MHRRITAGGTGICSSGNGLWTQLPGSRDFKGSTGEYAAYPKVLTATRVAGRNQLGRR